MNSYGSQTSRKLQGWPTSSNCDYNSDIAYEDWLNNSLSRFIEVN